MNKKICKAFTRLISMIIITVMIAGTLPLTVLADELGSGDTRQQLNTLTQQMTPGINNLIRKTRNRPFPQKKILTFLMTRMMYLISLLKGLLVFLLKVTIRLLMKQMKTALMLFSMAKMT